MALGLSTGSQNNVANLYRRLRSTRGFVPKGAEYEAIRAQLAARYQPHLSITEMGSNREIQEKQIANQEAQVGISRDRLAHEIEQAKINNQLNREAQEKADRAAAIQGYTSMGTMALATPYAYKAATGKSIATLWGGGAATTTGAGTTGVASGTTAAGAATSTAAPTYGTTAAGYYGAGTQTAAGVGVGTTAAGAGAGAQTAAAGTAVPATMGYTAPAATTVGGSATGAGTVGAGQATATGAGSGTVGTSSMSAGVGVGASAVGGYVAGRYFGRSSTGENVGRELLLGHGGEQDRSAASGALAGAAIGFVVAGPVGAIVGGIAGAIGGGCIVFRYYYGQGSAQERYARIFCARHMTAELYIGYVIAGTKLIDVAETLPATKGMLEKFIVEPFYAYMMWKLKGVKIPYWKKVVARKLLKWFAWEAEQVKKHHVYLHKNCQACYQTASTEVK